MFEMWNTVTSKLEAHQPVQTNVQAVGGSAAQTQSSGSIKGKKHNNIPINRIFNLIPLLKLSSY